MVKEKKSILAWFLSWKYCSTNYRVTIEPSISSLTHEMYIPRCERVCWKSHID